MNRALVSTENLDRIWNQWLETQPLTSYERSWVLGRPFGASSRSSNKSQKFELWLFNQGGSIRRINKKYFLEFSVPEQASFFLLRWL